MTTMAKLFDMLQTRATLTESIRTLMDKYDGKEMPAEDKASLAKLEADYDKLNGQIVAEQKQLERERVIGEKAPAAPVDAKKAEQMAAFRAALASGSREDMKVYAALQMDNPTQAGYLVPPEEFRTEMIKEMADLNIIRQKARVLPPLRGAHSLGFPTRTSAMTGGAWGTEISTAPTATSSAYGKREFKPNPYTALDKISETLVRNLPSADGLVRGDFAEHFANALETVYMTGHGAGQPLGLFTASADGINTDRDVSTGNTATEIKFDGLYEAKYAVKAGYQPACEWYFHRDAVKYLAKLKDSNGQYVWQPSVVLGAPDMLLGKPVNMSEYIPHTFTAGLYVGLYGDMKYYWIVDSLLFQIKVLAELYAETNQIGYIGRLETDGAPVLSAAFARVKLG
jgi:HK97 family phage major capsid protein